MCYDVIRCFNIILFLKIGFGKFFYIEVLVFRSCGDIVRFESLWMLGL